MKKLILVICIVVLLFFGCKDKLNASIITDRVDTLNWQVSEMPRYFYPSINLTEVEKQIVNNLYEGLTRVIDDQVILAIAEEIEISPDKRTYTIKLKSAQWSDGKLVTPEDFIYSWERKKNYYNEINLLYFDSYINRVDIVDSRVLKIHLTKPNEKLLHQLSTVGFMPLREDVINLDERLPNFISDVTNGPFVLDSFMFFSGIKLKKNIHYAEYYAVELDAINIVSNNDYASVYSKYKHNDYDIITSVPEDNLDYFIQYEDDFKLLNKNGVYAYSINPKSDILSDLLVRKILNLSLDRSEINPYEDYIKDSVAYSIFDESVMKPILAQNHTSNVTEDNYKVTSSFASDDKVKFLLNEYEGSLSSLDQMRIVTRNTENDLRIAKLIRDSWLENLGVYFLIDAKDVYDYKDALKTGSYDIILNTHYYTQFDSRHMLKYFFASDLNKTLFRSVEFDENLLESHIYEKSSLHRVYEQLIEEVTESAIMIPLFNTYEPVIVHPRLENWSRSYENLFFFGYAKKTYDMEEDVIENR